jgi:TonB family protein
MKFEVADGKIRIDSAGPVRLCFAFSVPPSPQDMRLEISGKEIAMNATPPTRNIVLPNPGSLSNESAGRPSPPSCKQPVEPNYTQEAHQAHIQGAVTIEAIVQKDGTMTPTRIVKGLGYGLDEEAMNVLKKWNCSPALLNGQPVALRLQVVVNFHLY